MEFKANRELLSVQDAKINTSLPVMIMAGNTTVSGGVKPVFEASEIAEEVAEIDQAVLILTPKKDSPTETIIELAAKYWIVLSLLALLVLYYFKNRNK